MLSVRCRRTKCELNPLKAHTRRAQRRLKSQLKLMVSKRMLMKVLMLTLQASSMKKL